MPQLEIPDVSLLRRVIARVQLSEGAPHRALKTPTALQEIEIRKIDALRGEEQTRAMLKALAMLMPDATPDEIADLDAERIVGLVQLASDPILAMQNYAAGRLGALNPNGMAGTTRTPSDPATPSTTSAGESPSPVGNPSGAS